MTTTTQDENFLNLVASDPAMSARWDSIVDSVIQIAAESGATITADDCLRIPSARLAAMSTEGSLDDTFLSRELSTLPQVKEAKRAQAMRDEVAAGNEEALAALDRLSPSQRLNWARQNGAMQGTDRTDRPEKLTPDEEKKLIERIADFSPSERMRIARKFGLGV